MHVMSVLVHGFYSFFNLPTDDFLWEAASKTGHYPIEANRILHICGEKEFNEIFLFTALNLFKARHSDGQQTPHRARTQPEITC